MRSASFLTGQLRLYSNGNHEAGNALFADMFPRLRQLAARTLSNEGFRAPVTPTELVGETWLSNLRRGGWEIRSREHFFNIVGLAMEQVLTDMARKRLAQRRGMGVIAVSLDEVPMSHQPKTADAEQLLAICLLLERLAKENAKVAAVVRLHYVVGFSLEEIAAGKGLTLRQVRYRWEKGKNWLAAQLLPPQRRLRSADQDHQ